MFIIGWLICGSVDAVHVNSSHVETFAPILPATPDLGVARSLQPSPARTDFASQIPGLSKFSSGLPLTPFSLAGSGLAKLFDASANAKELCVLGKNENVHLVVADYSKVQLSGDVLAIGTIKGFTRITDSPYLDGKSLLYFRNFDEQHGGKLLQKFIDPAVQATKQSEGDGQGSTLKTYLAIKQDPFGRTFKYFDLEDKDQKGLIALTGGTIDGDGADPYFKRLAETYTGIFNATRAASVTKTVVAVKNVVMPVLGSGGDLRSELMFDADVPVMYEVGRLVTNANEANGLSTMHYWLVSDNNIMDSKAMCKMCQANIAAMVTKLPARNLDELPGHDTCRQLQTEHIGSCGSAAGVIHPSAKPVEQTRKVSNQAPMVAVWAAVAAFAL